MKKVLYFYPNISPFVEADREILGKKYKVASFEFKPVSKWQTPISFLLQFFFVVLRLPRIKMMFSQFSGYHTFLPALFSKIIRVPHYIVLNGTECNNFPEIDYGFLHRPLLFWFSKKSLQWSTKLFPVSQSLVSADYTYMSTKYVRQGYMNFYEDVNTPYSVIYNGISADHFKINLSVKKKDLSFVTVASGLELQKRWAVKGLDLIIELARRTPGYHYTFIGRQTTDNFDLPANITIIDFVPHHELSDLYNQHQFYLQLSISEGFGISVCEAMLSGCVPIVSDVGIMPCLAGTLGYVLQTKNIELLVALVNRAVTEYNPDNSFLYRQHILDHFQMKIREKKLLEEIEL